MVSESLTPKRPESPGMDDTWASGVPTPSGKKGPLLVPATGLLGWISAGFLELRGLIELREALRCL